MQNSTKLNVNLKNEEFLDKKHSQFPVFNKKKLLFAKMSKECGKTQKS